MVADKMVELLEPITNKDVFLYLNSCDFAYISNNKHTKSIYFKDADDNFTVLIYSILHGHSSVLATINGKKYNAPIENDEFFNLYNKYKIFLSN